MRNNNYQKNYNYYVKTLKNNNDYMTNRQFKLLNKLANQAYHIYDYFSNKYLFKYSITIRNCKSNQTLHFHYTFKSFKL